MPSILGSAVGAIHTERKAGCHSAFLTSVFIPLQEFLCFRGLSYQSSHILVTPFNVCLPCSTVSSRDRSTSPLSTCYAQSLGSCTGGMAGTYKHLMSDQASGLYKISSVQMIPSGIGPQVHAPGFSGGLYEGGNALDNLDLSSSSTLQNPHPPPGSEHTHSAGTFIPINPSCLLGNHSCFLFS